MDERNQLIEFIREWGTLLLAVYGVVQVWLIALLRRFLWPGRLAIFEGGRLEIGYSNFGPNIGLNGTLRAMRKPLSVSSMTLDLVRKRDGARHELRWLAFRAPQIRVSSSDTVQLELASGFLVRLEQPHRFNIFFSDQETRAEIEPALLAAKDAWQGLAYDRRAELMRAVQEENVPVQVAVENLYNQEFLALPPNRQAYDVLSRKNYWEAGRYELTLHIETASPAREFKKRWSFALTDADFERLRLNSVTTIRELCIGMGQAQYFFAYPSYEDAV
jgi:hypothetical protein